MDHRQQDLSKDLQKGDRMNDDSHAKKQEYEDRHMYNLGQQEAPRGRQR